MSKIEQITVSEARFPLAKLILSPINPRQYVPEQDVIELAESIWEAGLIQNIAGLADDKGGAEIVAGGRRLRALKYLAEQHPDMAQVKPDLANPIVMLAPNAEIAEVWAQLENVARRDLHPAEEIRAYGKMQASGKTAPAIARAFAVTEKHVYRRLALAHLAEPIIEALAAGEISLSMAACFTISDDEARSLEVLDTVRGQNFADRQIKNMLKPDSVNSTDRRAIFVGENAYSEAGGKLGGDLFAEQALFDDPALLDKLFMEALEQEAAKIAESEGWKWVEAVQEPWVCSFGLGLDRFGRLYRIEGELNEEQTERYDELAELAEGDVLDEAGEKELAALQATIDGAFSEDQKAHCGAYICVNNAGEVCRTEGMVRPEDKPAAIEAGLLKASRHTAQPVAKSPISAKLADDLSRIARGARQHALLRAPDLLIDLLAYQLSHEMRWSKPFGINVSEVANWPTTEGAGYALDERLSSNPPRDMWEVKDFGASFRAFRKKGADHIRGELSRFLASQYQGGDETLATMIERETQPNIREVWTPTAENFFGRVGGPYMVALWCDLLDLEADHPSATSFAKLKKSEKAAKLEALFGDAEVRKAQGVTEEQVVRIDAWVPEGMA